MAKKANNKKNRVPKIKDAKGRACAKAGRCSCDTRFKTPSLPPKRKSGEK